jgi:8-oxo-dGTP pyrophosphatase MutT (NUDIX family)
MPAASIEGMTRAALDEAEARDFALGDGPRRPRDAATLILLDRRNGDLLVLMGRRHAKHAFMPGKFVFPGGRTDPSDGRVPVAAGLHPAEAAQITASSPRVTATRARAIALSAIRETYEEAGLLIGRKDDFVTTKPGWQAFADHGVQPSLDGLRLVARAITPPGRVRRFDTRFLAAWKGTVAVSLPGGPPTDELEELVWLPIAEAKQLDLPRITSTILNDLERRIAADPELRPGGPVPFYRMRNNLFLRQLL